MHSCGRWLAKRRSDSKVNTALSSTVEMLRYVTGPNSERQNTALPTSETRSVITRGACSSMKQETITIASVVKIFHLSTRPQRRNPQQHQALPQGPAVNLPSLSHHHNRHLKLFLPPSSHYHDRRLRTSQ